ncbi:1211_t:CDS:1, partial [Funneliformis mosseae]
MSACIAANKSKENYKRKVVSLGIAYIAPEVLLGRPFIKAADNHSLGIV